jgi:large subunit ribosomal protein L17
MRHRNAGRKLSRDGSHRAALFSNMAIALIEHGRIKTTDAKAKELRRYVERLVTIGKRGGDRARKATDEKLKAAHQVAARRRAYALLRHQDSVVRLFDIAERFKDRHGGYTRIMKIGHRHGDAAPMSFIEFVDYEKKQATEETASEE